MKAVAVAALAAGLFTSSTEALAIAKRETPRVVGMQIERRQTSKIVVSSSLRRRSQTISQGLDNFEDGSLYFANATIGTPPQNFRFHVDTGSSDLWANVATSQICKSTSGGGAGQAQGNVPCSVSGEYDANKSSTYSYVNSDFQIKYADGTGASGDYVTDNFVMGGATVKNQQFGVGYTSTSSEGVMGIGYPALEAFVQNTNSPNPPQPYSNLPQSMVSQGLINAPAYSLWLDTVNNATGNILFGGIDTDKYMGSLVTLDIVQENNQDLEMIVELNGVSVSASGQNQTALSAKTPVLLDSGSTLSYLPSDAVSTIYKAVGAQYDSQQQLAFCSCNLANSSDTMSFSFGNGAKVISIDMAEMVLEGGVSQDLDCTFGIVPQQQQSGGGSSFTLGDSFIRNAYLVYDLDSNQISIAQTDRDATSSNVMEIQKSNAGGVPDASGTATTNASKSLATTTFAPKLLVAIAAGVALVFAAL